MESEEPHRAPAAVVFIFAPGLSSPLTVLLPETSHLYHRFNRGGKGKGKGAADKGEGDDEGKGKGAREGQAAARVRAGAAARSPTLTFLGTLAMLTTRGGAIPSCAGQDVFMVRLFFGPALPHFKVRARPVLAQAAGIFALFLTRTAQARVHTHTHTHTHTKPPLPPGAE